jgi:prephenate dehydratase
MKLLYEWIPWSYSYQASKTIKSMLNIFIDELVGMIDFPTIWENIDEDHIAILPIENSYAWNIHQNLYSFLRYRHKIYGEFFLNVNHCLLSAEKDITKIQKAYSHPQALAQCHNFLKNHNIQAKIFSDTASAAKYISEKQEPNSAAISSEICAELYWLNKIQTAIQDQKGNTTRFLIVGPVWLDLEYSQKSNKTTLIYSANNAPASLYHCLAPFAAHGINLSKIESLPAYQDPFSYAMFLEFEWTQKDKNVAYALANLETLTKEIIILWEY